MRCQPNPYVSAFFLSFFLSINGEVTVSAAFDLSFWALLCHRQLALFSDGCNLPIRLNNDPAFPTSGQVSPTFFRWTPLEHSWGRYGFTPPVDLLSTARLDKTFLCSTPKRRYHVVSNTGTILPSGQRWTYSHAVRRRTICPLSDITWLHHVSAVVWLLCMKILGSQNSC